MVLTKSVLFAAALVSAKQQPKKGTEKKCFGPRMHDVEYDIVDYDDNGNPVDFTVSIKPNPDESSLCAPTNGGSEKAVCVGVNTADCMSAAEAIPINEYLSCSNCFIGLTTDLFYDLEVSGAKLKKMSLGLKDTHVRGAVEVKAQADATQTVAQGSIAIITREMESHISFMAGDVIPVDITFRLPTELSYALTLSAAATVEVGADVDILLGDHTLSYTSGDGFTQEHTKINAKSFTWTPVLSGDAQASAEVPLGLTSTLEVEVEKLVSYDMHLTSALPMRADWNSETPEQICVKGDASFSLNHEANVHFEIFGYQKTIAAFGPEDIYTNSWPSLFDTCITIPTEDVLV